MIRKVFLLLSACSAILTGAGYVYKDPTKFDLCLAAGRVFDPSCINNYNLWGNAAFYAFGALTLSFLLVALSPKSFSWWWKFAILGLPAAGFFFWVWLFTPTPGMEIFKPIDVFRFVSTTFFVLSVTVVVAHAAYSKYKMRKSIAPKR